MVWCGVVCVEGHERDRLLNVQPLESITIVNVSVSGGRERMAKEGMNVLVSEP